MRKEILVVGDSVAAVFAAKLRDMPSVTSDYDVTLMDGGLTHRLARESEVVFEQVGRPGERSRRAFRCRRHVRFPTLDFKTMWPFNCVNPFNQPEPPAFPHGRFPYGDSFLIACVKAGVSRDLALKLFATFTWSPTWPDLKKSFQRDEERFNQLDASTDVAIGRYVLDNYQLQRLFLAPHCPSNVLLTELFDRLVARGLSDCDRARSDMRAKFPPGGNRDVFGLIEVPIHPLVALELRLRWYDPRATFNYFDVERLNTRRYFERLYSNAELASAIS